MSVSQSFHYTTHQSFRQTLFLLLSYSLSIFTLQIISPHRTTDHTSEILEKNYLSNLRFIHSLSLLSFIRERERR